MQFSARSFIITFFFTILFLIYPLADVTSKEKQVFTEEKFEIELNIKTEKDLQFLKELGLDCSSLGVCICMADTSQLLRLKKVNYPFRPPGEVRSAEKSQNIKQSRVFQLKLEIKNEVELNLIKILGLVCTRIGECTTEVDIEQMKQLKQNSINFSGIREGIRIEGTSSPEGIHSETFKPAGSIYGENDSNYYVPWAQWVYSPINIDNASYDAKVEEIEVRYYIHDFSGEINTLAVDLTNENVSKEYRLWNYEGSGYYIDETEKDTSFFDGENVNQIWKLWVLDSSYPGYSYILNWHITIWFSGPPICRANSYDYYIPDIWDSVCSPIIINTAPSNARVTSLDIHYDIIHPYIGDLLIWATDADNSSEYVLCCSGSSSDVHETVTGITEFNGELVNQTWKLCANDWFEGDYGYIDFWSITLWYQDLPDLVIKSMTPSNTNPMKDSIISVDIVIKNQGSREASSFYVGLYYNLSYPPDIYTWEDKEEYISSLASDSSKIVTFTGVTSYDTATWNMYGLADCDGYIQESNEDSNYIGPKTVKWRDPGSLPDLVIEEALVSGYCPYTTDSVFVNVTIKNIGGSNAYHNFGFYTDIFYNQTSPPIPPATGDAWHLTFGGGGLKPDSSEAFTFVLPNPSWAETWIMWLLVDSDPNRIIEGNENNNVYGPIEIEWMEPSTYRITSITRDQIVSKGLEFTNVRWICPVINGTTRVCTIENDWTSDYMVGVEYKGEAYEWGGFDDTTHFHCNLNTGLIRAGSQKDNDCISGDYGNPSWATGIDCSGLVTRAFGITTKKSATMLIDYCDSLKGGYEYVLRGDILIKRGKHTYIFDSWAKSDSMCVIEAGDFRERDPDGSSEARKWYREKEFYQSYFGYKNKNVPITIDHNRSGDANSDGKVSVSDITYLINYLFNGSNILPHPLWRGDANGDCKVSVSDVVYLVNYLFKGGYPPNYCQSCSDWTCFPYP